MQSVKNARKRMLQFPQAISECTAQATAYGKCVAVKEDVKQYDCQKEFEALKECVRKATKKLK